MDDAMKNELIDYALRRVVYNYPAIEGARWYVHEQGDGKLVLCAEEPRRGYVVRIDAAYINAPRDISRDRDAMQTIADRWNSP